MLAENRRKQKLSADPRNLHWANDKSKFGHKMMEKMGWSEGTGLGKAGQGAVDAIKVNTTSDNRGVGCNKVSADAWIAHQDDFNQLLTQLNQANPKNTVDPSTTLPISLEDNVQCLTAKSKSTATRMFYGKFSKSKDLSCRTSDDLDALFGKRKGEDVSPPNAHQTIESVTLVKSDLQQTVSECSMQDYFARKMAMMKGNKTADSTTNNIDEEIIKSAEIPGEPTRKKKKKKRRPSNEVESSATTVNSEVLTMSPEGNESFLERTNEQVSAAGNNGKKKKRKHDDCTRDIVATQSTKGANGGSDEDVGLTMKIDENKKSSKKKKKKRTVEE